MDKLHCEISGDRTQPTLTFLHGFLGSAEDFAGIARALRDRFCTVRLDLPGHGQSLLMTGYELDATANLVLQALDQQGITQTYLYGYSMGGRLALYLAVQYPDRFPQVILESASPGLRSPEERSARQQQDGMIADRLETLNDWPNWLDDWYGQPLFASLREHPEFAALLIKRSANQPAFLAKSLRGMSVGRQPNLWPDLKALKVGLHLLVGDRDNKFRAIQAKMLAACPTATGSIVENTGHNIHAENPAAVIREIAGFYRGNCLYDAAPNLT
jgi:2-succinyl-6-hydroxy-2,4-cyclohexadiene-1-carboxylate synthase